MQLFFKTRKMALVLDESHKIKNPESKTTQAIFKLKDFAYKRIILSGTPIANKPVDIWAQYYFLDNGNLLGNNFNEFKKKYFSNLKKENLSENEHIYKELKNKIKANSIRRKKDDVLELPEKVFIDKYVELNGIQKNMYEQLKKKLFLEIQDIEGDFVIDESNNLLKKILRLAQISSNPFLVDKSYKEIPVKFPMLDILIKDIINANEKVIIWSSFIDNIKILYKKYKQYGSQMLYGNIPIIKRNQIIQIFKNNNEYKILIANPAVAREGLTLTVANNAIYLDRNFNLVDYLQSQDRIHRISQKKVCNIYKIIAKGTIDEYIDEIIYKKYLLAGFIQGDREDLKTNNEFITKERLLEILG